MHDHHIKTELLQLRRDARDQRGRGREVHHPRRRAPRQLVPDAAHPAAGLAVRPQQARQIVAAQINPFGVNSMAYWNTSDAGAR